MINWLGRWAETYRAEGRYTPVGVAFHWIMAAVVIVPTAMHRATTARRAKTASNSFFLSSK